MSKIYVKQINPEYQESPVNMMLSDFVTMDDNFPGLILVGNRVFHEYTNSMYDKWNDNWEDALDNLCALEEFKYNRDNDLEFNPDDYILDYKTKREIIEDFFKSEHEYTDAEIEQWCNILHDMETCYQSEEYRLTLNALDLITGHKWDYATLRGCCQGDWQECYYDTALWSKEAIAEFECEYFNLGTEWVVHDRDTEPSSVDDIEGYAIYTHDFKSNSTREELAQLIGCAEEDLVIYKYVGERRVPVYEEDN